MILEGRPWLFRKQLIIFEKLKKAIEMSKIKLVLSMFWLKIGSCLPEYEKKDLMHAIDSTFGEVPRSKIKGDACRLKVQLDIQKPLQRGIFISVGNQERVSLPFKYENLLIFCFGCGCMGHVVKDYLELKNLGREQFEGDLPYSVALCADSNILVVRYQGEESSPSKVVLPNFIRMKDGNPNGLDGIMEEKPKISKQLGWRRLVRNAMDKNAKIENVMGKRKYRPDGGRDGEYSSLCANSRKKGRLI
ncbi:hypothetical protein J1N35_014341 [Gossypium stocksii]|uniref:Zinc knuckle CX2CX4HX4C domain-containing protein n=1 Tax=Gossypium stocksii TaxID=47602 RepID=A0A9D3VTX1_9ROSI|nr:hypothetical protein J1N35_014341 [Gossypium stocksii]